MKQVKIVDTDIDTKMYIEGQYAGDISRMTPQEVLEMLENFGIIKVEKVFD